MIFLQPQYLWLLLPAIIIFLLDILVKRLRGPEYFAYSSLNATGAFSQKWKLSAKKIAFYSARIMLYLAMIMIIFALADPAYEKKMRTIQNEGIDIVIALDISDSMAAEDFKPNNRLYVAKQVIHDFIRRRQTDRIGLVIFSGEGYLQCPLTMDYHILTDILADISFSTIGESGTAIGNALALASSVLYQNETKSKIIILLTDGVNNRGKVDPETVAEAAGQFGIKIYTIGIGKEGMVSGSIPDGMGRQRQFRFYNHFDAETLQNIAKLSSGKYYHALSAKDLWQKVKEIDRLERSVFEQKKYYEQDRYFLHFLVAAIIIIIFSTSLERFYVRPFP